MYSNVLVSVIGLRGIVATEPYSEYFDAGAFPSEAIGLILAGSPVAQPEPFRFPWI